MCVISYKDSEQSLTKLVHALKDIEQRFAKQQPIHLPNVLNEKMNELAMTPQQASQQLHETINIYEAIGRISADSIMIYPPGIPLVIPGEVISSRVLQVYDFYSRNIGNVLVETQEKHQILVLKGDR